MPPKALSGNKKISAKEIETRCEEHAEKTGREYVEIKKSPQRRLKLPRAYTEYLAALFSVEIKKSPQRRLKRWVTAGNGYGAFKWK